MYSSSSSNTNMLYADSSLMNKYKLSIELDDNPTGSESYFVGDSIRGHVRLCYQEGVHDTSRLDIHLSCTFLPRDDSQRTGKRKLFQILVSPCPIVTPYRDVIPFVIPIPSDMPSSLTDKTLPGIIVYKIKAIHELPSLPVSLFPKASMQLSILDCIAKDDMAYQSPVSNEKELKMNIPKDITGKYKSKSSKSHSTSSLAPVHAKLSIPSSCFLSGQNIAFSLHIQHIAPIKQMQGIQVQLERIINMTYANGERSLETQVLSETILPLICDVEDYSATVKSHLTVPADASPTLQTPMCPLQLSYRIKAMMNVDINSLLDESIAPSRKRDIAKGMVNSWGKRIGWSDEEASMTASLFGNMIIDLELPITMGTTTTASRFKSTAMSSSSACSLHSISNESQTSNTSSSSMSSCVPKLPVRPSSLTNYASSPALLSTYYQHHALAHSPTSSDNANVTSSSLTAPIVCRSDGKNIQRSITDPFSLTNHNYNMTIAAQPSAPELCELEETSNIKGNDEKSKLAFYESWACPPPEPPLAPPLPPPPPPPRSSPSSLHTL